MEGAEWLQYLESLQLFGQVELPGALQKVHSEVLGEAGTARDEASCPRRDFTNYLAFLLSDHVFREPSCNVGTKWAVVLQYEWRL